jgi:hypothetical protein
LTSKIAQLGKHTNPFAKMQKTCLSLFLRHGFRLIDPTFSWTSMGLGFIDFSSPQNDLYDADI